MLQFKVIIDQCPCILFSTYIINLLLFLFTFPGTAFSAEWVNDNFTSIKLSWQPDSGVATYTVTYTPVNASGAIDSSSEDQMVVAGSTVTLSGLNPMAWYIFRVEIETLSSTPADGVGIGVYVCVRVCVCVCVCVRGYCIPDSTCILYELHELYTRSFSPFSGVGVAFGVIVVLAVALLLVLSILWSASHFSLVQLELAMSYPIVQC